MTNKNNPKAGADMLMKIWLVGLFAFCMYTMHSGILARMGTEPWLDAVIKTFVLLPVMSVALPLAYTWGFWRD